MHGRLWGLGCDRAAVLAMERHPVAAPSTNSVAYHIDAAHDGVLNGVTLKPPLKKLWSLTFGSEVQYPLVVNGVVYALAERKTTATDPPDVLWALNETTGKVLWHQALRQGGVGIAYDNGSVFTVDAGGLVTAFNAQTGVSRWSYQISDPNSWEYEGAPVAGSGIVYTTGAGDGVSLYAIDESNGRLLWSQQMFAGNGGSPALSGDSIFTTYPSEYYSFNATTGALNWNDNPNGEDGGGDDAVVADNRVYVRDWTEPANSQRLDGRLRALAGRDDGSRRDQQGALRARRRISLRSPAMVWADSSGPSPETATSTRRRSTSAACSGPARRRAGSTWSTQRRERRSGAPTLASRSTTVTDRSGWPPEPAPCSCPRMTRWSPTGRPGRRRPTHPHQLSAYSKSVSSAE